MSLKEIKEALDYLENNPTADEAQDARRSARRGVAALEKAAKALVENRFSATVAEERNAEIDWAAMETLMESIANEGEE